MEMKAELRTSSATVQEAFLFQKLQVRPKEILLLLLYSVNQTPGNYYNSVSLCSYGNQYVVIIADFIL